MEKLDVTIAQTELHWHDAERNLALFTRLLATLEQPTDLIVLPEMFTSGFTMQPEGNAQKMDGSAIRWMADTAAATQAAICGSLIIEEDGRYYNRFVLMRPDGRHEHYDKRHLFRLAGEHQSYNAGAASPTFVLNGWRIRPTVCYDLRFPVWSRNRGDYDLLVNAANWPASRQQAWDTLIRARAIENLSYVAAVNRVGQDGNDIDYKGGSAIVDFLGNCLACPGERPGLAHASLCPDELAAFREKFPFHADADDFVIEQGAEPTPA